MNNSILVSILIPCYNHEAFLDDCLESIMAQTYDNIELFICDDCSPDGSFEKICSYESALKKRFPRVVILRNEVNCGVTKNINRMLSQAKGEYIKILASDDAMAPDAISELVAFMQENPDASVAVVNGLKVPEDQHYPNFSGSELVYETAPDFSSEGFFERLARCNPVFAPGAMVRASVYETFGNYDETIKVEDYEFWLRILKDGQAKIAYLDQPLLYYRINANSMSSMTGNAGLAKRRKLFHLSEVATLDKFRSYFDPAAYADIVLSRIFDERWLAVEYRLTEWEKELQTEWNSFQYWKDLPIKRRLNLRLQYFRQTAKKLIRRNQ